MIDMSIFSFLCLCLSSLLLPPSIQGLNCVAQAGLEHGNPSAQICDLY